MHSCTIHIPADSTINVYYHIFDIDLNENLEKVIAVYVKC